MDQTAVRRFSQQVDPAAAHLRHFDVVPAFDLDSGQLNQRFAAAAEEGLERNIVFVHGGPAKGIQCANRRKLSDPFLAEARAARDQQDFARYEIAERRTEE